jgi:hypothetical protein
MEHLNHLFKIIGFAASLSAKTRHWQYHAVSAVERTSTAVAVSGTFHRHVRPNGTAVDGAKERCGLLLPGLLLG